MRSVHINISFNEMGAHPPTHKEKHFYADKIVGNYGQPLLTQTQEEHATCVNNFFASQTIGTFLAPLP